MRLSINDDGDFKKKTNVATDKLLGLLKRHHSVSKPKKQTAKTIEIKEEKLCESCGDPLFRLDHVPSVQDIKRATTRYFILHPTDLDSRRKTNHLAYARQIAMYLSRTLTENSYPEIGRRLGGRDHSTAIHGANKIAHLVKSDWMVAFDVAQIEGVVIGGFSNFISTPPASLARVAS